MAWHDLHALNRGEWADKAGLRLPPAERGEAVGVGGNPDGDNTTDMSSSGR